MTSSGDLADAPEDAPAIPYNCARIRRSFAGPLALLLVTRLMPASSWYRSVTWLLSVRARIVGSSHARSLDQIIDSLLQRLTQSGRPFAIPLKVEGLAFLPPRGPVQNGVLYCSGHLPLVRIGLRALIELGHGPTAVVAHPGTFTANTKMVPVWGLREQIPAIASGRNALIEVRSVLRRGGSVSLLTDVATGGEHSRNAYRLARRLGTRIVFFFTELQPDGTILVTFKKPPYPICTTEESIETNVVWLARELRKIGARMD